MMQGEMFEQPGSRPVCLLLDQMDLRHFLTRGVIPSPEDHPGGPGIPAGFSGDAWLQCDESQEFVVPAASKPCLVRLDFTVEEGEEKNRRVFPSSRITHVIFEDEETSADFTRRNSIFDDLPTAHFHTGVDPELRFRREEVPEDGGEPESASEPERGTDGPDQPGRAVGAVAGLLALGRVPHDVLKIIDTTGGCSRALVEQCLELLWGQEESSHSSIRFLLDLLADPGYSKGFDPLQLLDPIQEGLGNCVLSEEVLAPWAHRCRDILENRIEADPRLLEDRGDLLLRSLMLVLRTSPLGVRELAAWREHSPSIGDRVHAAALLLSGWYQGFASQKDSKTNPALYRYASCCLAAEIGQEPQLNPTTELISETEDSGVRRYTLRESGKEITVTVLVPDPGLMEAWFATMRARRELGDELKMELMVDRNCFEVRGAAGTIIANLEETRLLRWRAEWSWKDRGRQRKWQARQYEEIARFSRQAKCSVYPIEFPRCGLHLIQVLGTMDHEEVRFQLESILEALLGLDKLEMVIKKGKSDPRESTAHPPENEDSEDENQAATA